MYPTALQYAETNTITEFGNLSTKNQRTRGSRNSLLLALLRDIHRLGNILVIDENRMLRYTSLLELIL